MAIEETAEEKILTEDIPAEAHKGKEAPKGKLPAAKAPALSNFSERGRRRRAGLGKGPRAKPEFDQKILSIRRVARVMAGGRRFSFSVALVAGDRKGRVGVGVGKALDTPSAISKAFRDAQKNMITVKMSSHFTIPNKVRGKAGSSEVLMIPAPVRGILAGSSVRDVVELAGIKNINAKIISRSKNKLNNARAAVAALSKP
ncbi:MAG: small subunit ribosomal protein S5 [Parcubacteria group bacterium Gr01-1014_107]|nr:MAG: small subunit ribosomal protein S5 [Parcubacteria group bacterium Gr01-1014_107]